MKCLTATLVVTVMAGSPAFGWGYVGHRLVAENAAVAMPAPLASFFASATKGLSDASIEPDSQLKKRFGAKEKRSHYLDLEDLKMRPGEEIPSDVASARAKYGRTRLEKAGMLPWRVAEVHAALTKSFRAGDWPEVVRFAGWLSHYAADACQPLHTTSNHDGQLTGNKGIHAAFETEMIDRYRAVYRKSAVPATGFKPEPIADPAGRVIREILSAHQRVDALLQADTQTMLSVRKNNADYLKGLKKRAGEIAEQQLVRAVELTASLWHSAWTAAGRPALPDRLPPSRLPTIRGDSSSRSPRVSPRR